ncbi:hypothetical protein B9G69_008600 [Bdellovibrio sp. SKB1291214]|uniref:hypothetical protein n=1 Tax=Bdellovibrio sp. SKB1291214 TaxID=1732569 RepID=UPI000B519264|nr:hypothetical protein [Bdellovibrio sp. SKB1291214]UYL10633.1 hypothetical protein B9G69_008600 [Bdellovibrio sp. SKB1291214]
MLSKILFIGIIFTSGARASDPVALYGFGKSAQELGIDGFRAVSKSGGTQIYDKSVGSSYYKIVYKKNEYVSRIYRQNNELYMQYTKLDDQGKVLGQAQCKFLKSTKFTSCDGQTAGMCKELIGKVEAGGFDFDVKKMKECADLSSKINYSRAGADELLDEGAKALSVANGAIPTVVKSTPSSLQTLMKDYNACKMIESELSDAPEKKAVHSSTADSRKGAH